MLQISDLNWQNCKLHRLWPRNPWCQWSHKSRRKRIHRSNLGKRLKQHKKQWPNVQIKRIQQKQQSGSCCIL